MKLKSPSLVHDLAEEKIKAYIRQNQLIAGSKLPSERELAKELNVSRHTIREAYLALEARGLVVIEHGRGVFLLTLIDNVRPHPLITNVTDFKNIINLLQVRQIIECGAIPLAIENAKSDDYERLRNLVAMEKGQTYLYKSVVIPSVTFESEVINLSHNPSLISIEENVMDAWKSLWVRLKLSALKPFAQTTEHYEIIDAMEEGDVKLAQKCLYAHLGSILMVIDHATK